MKSTTKANAGIALLAIVSVAYLFWPNLAAQATRYIFSRSSNQTNSNLMGFTGVPAYVNFPSGGQKLGTYVTRVNPGSLAARMGLRPGSVLLTIDNAVADSPSTIDSLLRSRNSFDFTVVKLVGGAPSMKSASIMVNDVPVSPAYMAAKAAGRPVKNVADSDTTSISTLESYMVGLVNDDRHRAKGLPSLSANSRLADLARTYAEVLLAGGGGLSHYDKQGRSPYDRAKAAGIVCQIRENLASQHRLDKSKVQKDLVAAAEAQMMAEPDGQPNHRGNILADNARSIGVGIARNAGMLVIVQELSDTSP